MLSFLSLVKVELSSSCDNIDLKVYILLKHFLESQHLRDTVYKARLVESIADLVKEKRIDGIHYINDESGKDGMRIVIELKKDANPQVVLNKLFSYTQLQDTVGVIMLALVNGIPKVLTLKEMLEQYIDFQVDVITRRTKFDLKRLRKESIS